MALLGLYLDAQSRWRLPEVSCAMGSGYQSRHAEGTFQRRPWKGMVVSFRYDLRDMYREEFLVEIFHPEYDPSKYDCLQKEDVALSVTMTHRNDIIDPRITVSFPKNPRVGSIYRRLFGNESMLYEGLVYREYRLQLHDRITSEHFVPTCFTQGSIEDVPSREHVGFISQDSVIPFLERLLERKGLPQRLVILEA